MRVESEFLNFSAGKLVQMMGRIDTCVDKLSPDQIWQRGSENENSVGNLMLHLAGNVRQWVISGVGGQPDVRERDGEFAARGSMSPAELKAHLRATVEEALTVIRAVPAQRLTEPLKIQGYDTTGLAAIYQVVEHFSGHTFQIIFATKLMTSADLGFYAHLNRARSTQGTTG